MLRYLECLGTYVGTEGVNAAILEVQCFRSTVRYVSSDPNSAQNLDWGSGVDLNADPTRIRTQARLKQSYGPFHYHET